MGSTRVRKEIEIQKNRIEWTKIIQRKYKPRALKPGVRREVHAFDTETLDGWVKVLACSDTTYLEPDSIENMLSYLTQKKYRDSINFFYNIQYDFDSIAKSLPESNITELVEKGKSQYGAYLISYIPKKLFSIKLKKDNYVFYDLFQFYEMSLDKASKLYTTGVKNEDNLDRNLIGRSEEYWEEHHDEIIKYCIQDCILTKMLGELLQEEIHNGCGFYPKTYTSKAGLSKRYFREFCDIPFFREVPKLVQYYAFQAYHGGRFEVTERGRIGKCTGLDISSAYPYWISQLIDVRKGRWKNTNELHEDAYYGFYLATVDIPYMHLPPLAFNWGETVIYPCGSWTAYFTKEELECLHGLGEYEIIYGMEFYPDEIIYPFKEALTKLYDLKNNTSKEDFKYALYKKIMNSFYGSMYEKVKMFDGSYRAGMMFFPIYATLITANTRIQLWKKAVEYGKDCVSLATDGLLIKGNINHSNNKSLGGWENEGVGDSFILRSGIYSKGDEMRQRGVMTSRKFRTPYGYYENLFDYIREKPELTSYPILNYRPVHMREAVKHNQKYTIEEINVFKESEIAFDLNTEIKRVYDYDTITGFDLLNTNYKSMPHYLTEGKIEAE